jgi:hypothetical protein
MEYAYFYLWIFEKIHFILILTSIFTKRQRTSGKDMRNAGLNRIDFKKVIGRKSFCWFIYFWKQHSYPIINICYERIAF